MKKINEILKFIIFLIIGIFILQILTNIFVPKWVDYFDSPSARIKGFYNEKKGNIDVLVVGNSGVSRGYSPIKIWEEYGITSYNLGTSNQTMDFAYYLIKETIQYQDIKTVVLDMDSVFEEKNAPEGEYRKFFDNIKWGKVKLDAINDKNVQIDENDKISYIFPLLRFHSRWNQLEEDDFKTNLNYEYQKISYKGMAMIADRIPYIDQIGYMQEKNEKVDVSQKNLQYLNKIVELCQEKNINMLFIEIPSAINGTPPVQDWSLAKDIEVEKIANKYGINFIDFNLPEIQNQIEFDWKIDSSDGGNHLNIYGAEKVSNYIGKILSEKYNLPNHKDDLTIENDWNETVKKYEENKKKLEEKINSK